MINIRNLTATFCLTFTILLGSIGVSESALPIKNNEITNFQSGLNAYRRGDYASALREWTPLAEQGNAGAQTSLGLMYNNGEDVPQDNETAAEWHRISTEQGNADTLFNLDLMYRKREGVPYDHKAFYYYFYL